MPHASQCPSVWGAYVDVILVSSLSLMPLVHYGVYSVSLFFYRLMMLHCHTYLMPFTLFDA